MTGDASKQAVSPGGYEAYLKTILADSGDPSDPLEIMALQQMAWSHCRIGQLHADAASAKTPELRVALTLAAARLMAEHRKCMLALKEYRRSAAPPETVQAKQQDATVQVNGHPRRSKKKNNDTKVRSKRHKHNGDDTNGKADRRPTKSTPAKGSNGSRPPKVARFDATASALAALNGSSNGHG